MRRILGRPVGVAALCALLVANGLTAFASAGGLFGAEAASPVKTGLTALGVPVALATAIVGLLLLRRSYLLWTYHRGAWLTTVIIMSAGAVLAVLSLVAAPLAISGWFHLVVSLGSVILLVRPSVRSLF